MEPGLIFNADADDDDYTDDVIISNSTEGKKNLNLHRKTQFGLTSQLITIFIQISSQQGELFDNLPVTLADIEWQN